MLTGGVEMPLDQLHLLVSNLDRVAFWRLDLHKQPNISSKFNLLVFGTQQGLKGESRDKDTASSVFLMKCCLLQDMLVNALLPVHQVKCLQLGVCCCLTLWLACMLARCLQYKIYATCKVK